MPSMMSRFLGATHFVRVVFFHSGTANQARAMAVFEMVLEDEPVLLEQKRREIEQAAQIGRQQNQKLFV